MIKEDVASFLEDWNSEADFVWVHTSGSTGEPKPFKASKQKMTNSARMTCDFLGLKDGDTALLCMPMKYIAGKMVVVRSLVRNLNLVIVEPSGHPLKDINVHLNFAAMTPMQVFNSLAEPTERQRLSEIDNLIIGGGAIDDALATELQKMPNRIFSTYGMTETLSHIAMRRINGNDASDFYKPMDGVKIGISPRGTLQIDAPMVCDETLITNDIAEIAPNGTFRIIGRTDNTINSGGVKIQIEEAERLLKDKLKYSFAATSIPDKKFGEALVLLVDNCNLEEVKKACEEAWPHLWQPKSIFNSRIPLTGTGKPDRANIRKIAECLASQRPDTKAQ